MNKLLDMLAYKRPEGSEHQKLFCDKYLQPVFGDPDRHGNYTLIIGDQPDIAFMSHHDTVHHDSGMQEVIVVDGTVISNSNCLGADCTTGVWIMLNMIEEGIDGVYVVHAAEEVGLIGATALVKDKPDWINHVDIAISFDRYGDTSIITHQMGERTASDRFALSLSDTLGLAQLKADTYGSYTDCEAYKDVIAECTNLSVGYYSQHTPKESQDLDYLSTLMDRLIKADWSQLVVARNPEIKEADDRVPTDFEEDISSAKYLMDMYPDFVANLLASSFDMDDLFGEVEDGLSNDYYKD